jgi:hypothetical protein
MEEKKATAGYVMQFFIDTENLSTAIAAFENTKSTLAVKYENDVKMQNMEPEEANVLEEQTGNVRLLVHRTYVHFLALAEKIKQFEKKESEIKKLYSKVTETHYPTISSLLDYEIFLNKQFISGIAEKFLANMGEELAAIGKTEA